jgi:predicted ester cyclase
MAASDIVEENKRLAQQFSKYAWSERFDDLRGICTPDAVVHDPAFGPEGTDIDGFIDYFEQLHTAWSDADTQMIDVVAEGDYVFYRKRIEATHTGEFMGVAPTNRRITIEEHIEIRIEDGKVAETWAQYDSMGLMYQIGVEIPGSA